MSLDILAAPEITQSAETGLSIPSSDTTATIYGLVDVGTRRLAVSAMSIREAVPFPESISPVPMSLPGLLGAMVLREETVPLVDLEVLLGIPPEQSALPDRVVIVVSDRQRTHLLGLVVNALRGMETMDASRTMEMGAINRSELLAWHRSFVKDNKVVCILELETLFELPDLPFARPRDRRELSAGRATKDRIAVLLCNYNGVGLAIPTLDVHATIPLSPVKNSPVAFGFCDGIIQHHGKEIPILDTLHLLGLGRNFCRPERTASIALSHSNGGLIALEIERFFDISHVDRSDLRVMPSVISDVSHLFQGVHISRLDGEHYYVLDTEAILREAAVEQLAATVRVDDEARTNQAPRAIGSHRTAEQYLISRSAQKRMASLLTDVVEIVRIPAHLQYCDVRQDGYMGTLNHRNQLVPVFSVPHLLGEFAFFDENQACILIIRVGNQMYGAAAEELEATAMCYRVGSSTDMMVCQAATGNCIPLIDFKRLLPLPIAVSVDPA